MKKFILLILLLNRFMTSFSQEETSILFIGNSFTFMNNMPFMLQDIAASKGRKMYVDTIVEGGKDLNFHASQAETYQAIRSRKWDYIVIQGHSNEFAQPDSKVNALTLPFMEKIVDSIRANSSCTQVILYMTWGYKYGNPKWAPISTYDSMQYRIKNQYLHFADLLDARISPVGEVWKTLRTNYSGINLYDPDNQHPSLAGSYVSACTFFASIFGESPVQNTAPVYIDQATKQIIELNAAEIVLNRLNQWRFIQKAPKMQANFDLVLVNDTLKVYNRSSACTFFEWSFGDGNLSIEESPSHCYQRKGKFTVALTMTDECKTIQLTREIEVK